MELDYPRWEIAAVITSERFQWDLLVWGEILDQEVPSLERWEFPARLERLRRPSKLWTANRSSSSLEEPKAGKVGNEKRSSLSMVGYAMGKRGSVAGLGFPLR